ncbi:MAG: MFS transporter [Opitutus sp.]
MKLRGLRWWIAVLLFGAAVLNYVDRQVLSALAPTVQSDLGLDDRDYANVLNLFLMAYTLAYLVAGKLTDRIGTRPAMGIFVLWWSISNALTAFTTGVRSLGAVRFSLGLGEAGVWPGASKAVSDWFPASERALAIGLYTMGATVGATLAPYVVIPLAQFDYAHRLPWLYGVFGSGTGWRMAFILTGAAGIFWLIPWLLLYRSPEHSSLLGAEERTLILAGRAQEVTESSTPWTWKQIFTSRIVWVLLLGRLITDPVWYFYQFWYPKYLHSSRGVAQDELTLTWIVYAAAGAGSLCGGWASGRLVRRGYSPVSSRLMVMLGCAVLVPLSPLIATVGGLQPALALTAVVVFAALAWLINISALVNDLVPRHSVASTFSVIAAGSTIGGIIMNMLVAAMVSGPAAKPGGFLDQAMRAVVGGMLQLVEGKGYAFAFVLMAFVHPLALVLVWSAGFHRRARA